MISEQTKQLEALMDAFNDQAAENEDLKGRLLAMDGRVLTAQDRLREAEATIERLRAAHRDIRLEVESHREEAPTPLQRIDDIARTALTGKEQE